MKFSYVIFKNDFQHLGVNVRYIAKLQQIKSQLSAWLCTIEVFMKHNSTSRY